MILELTLCSSLVLLRAGSAHAANAGEKGRDPVQ